MDDEYLEQYDLEYELEGISKFKERGIPELYRITRAGTRSYEWGSIFRSFYKYLCDVQFLQLE